VVACNLAKVDVPVRFRLPAPNMNINDDLKVIWWLPTRTASRSVAEILAYYKFYNAMLNVPLTQEHTHSIGVPPNASDYTVICNIRNPYAKVLSTWHLRHFKQDPKTGDLIIELPFDDYLRALTKNTEEHDILRYPRKPDLYVRVEHLVEDLRKVKFINFDDPVTNSIVESWIKVNNYTSEGCVENRNLKFDLRRDANNVSMTDYKSYYTQKQLDFVWEIYEDVFNEFGYSREFI